MTSDMSRSSSTTSLSDVEADVLTPSTDRPRTDTAMERTAQRSAHQSNRIRERDLTSSSPMERCFNQSPDTSLDTRYEIRCHDADEAETENSGRSPDVTVTAEPERGGRSEPKRKSKNQLKACLCNLVIGMFIGMLIGACFTPVGIAIGACVGGFLGVVFTIWGIGAYYGIKDCLNAT
ncbi:MAG: hypothetical protein OXF02_06960 [Simkaniaceae bacterium]|nr:hypothetical protein [Simkaniaceae bacterium]